MAYPPVLPPAGRLNSTPQVDAHPSDHNLIAGALTDIVARLDITTWTALPTLTAGWQVFPGYPPLAYRRALGWVEFQGLLNNGGAPAAGSTIFTMPVGYRPLGNMTVQLGATRLDIGTTGAVLYQGGGAALVTLNVFRYPLAGIGS